jgi:hypothetical protein
VWVEVGVEVGVGLGVGESVRVGVRVDVNVDIGVAVGADVGVEDGVLAGLRQPVTAKANATKTNMILQTIALRFIPLIMPALARIVNLRGLTKYPRYATITPNNWTDWTLLSRGVEGPALRNPGNRMGKLVGW